MATAIAQFTVRVVDATNTALTKLFNGGGAAPAGLYYYYLGF